MNLLRRMKLYALATLLLSAETMAMEHFGSPGAPPWSGTGLAALSDGHKHCLCGWLYNSAVTAWSALENQPGNADCEALCRNAPALTVAGTQAPKWKSCMAYSETAHDWQQGQAIARQGIPCAYFFPPNKTVADWEYGYASTGAPVKKINFFWWGNPSTEAYQRQAFDDADRWAALLYDQGYSIDYWAQTTATAVTSHYGAPAGVDGYVSLAKNANEYTVRFTNPNWAKLIKESDVAYRLKDGRAPNLGCRIGGDPCTVERVTLPSGSSAGHASIKTTGRTVQFGTNTKVVFEGRVAVSLKAIGNGGTFATPGALLHDTPLAGRANDLDNVVGSLSHHGVFVAVKDLVVLAILYNQGGYLFDTTVRPSSNNTDGAAAANLLTVGARALKCPVYVTDPKTGYGGSTYHPVIDNHDDVRSMFYEVNIMYHPARNEATKNALTCILDSWIGLGAGTGGAVVGPHAGLFTPAQKEARNEEIGNIATLCTTRAMVGCLHDQLVEGRLSAWLGRQPIGGEVERGVSKLICDQLGVTKVYKGTGR